MIILEWACYAAVLAYAALIFRHMCTVSNKTDGSKFKVGDRVVLSLLFVESTYDTGNHMPYHGEVLAVRRSAFALYEYDVLPDYSYNGDYIRSEKEANLTYPHDTDTNPKSLVRIIDDMSKVQ